MKEHIELSILEEEQTRTMRHIQNLQINLEQIENSMSKWKKCTLIGLGGTALFIAIDPLIATGSMLLTFSSFFSVQKRMEEKECLEDFVKDQKFWLEKLQKQISKVKMNTQVSSNDSLVVDTKEFQDYDFETFMNLLFPNLDDQKFQDTSTSTLTGVVDMSVAPGYIKDRLKQKILLRKGELVKG